MIRKVIFLISSPLNERDAHRFGLEIIRRNGFDLEVWDLTEILNPDRFRTYVPPDKSHFNECRFFPGKADVLEEIRRLAGDVFVVCILGYDPRSHFVFRALSKCGIPYGLYSYHYPSFNIGKKDVMSRILNIAPAKLAAYLFNAVPSRYLGVRPANVVLVLGGEFKSQKFAVGNNTRILWSHNFDYEIYSRLIKECVPQNDRMGVFLDQAFPFHPDAIGQPLFTAHDYYPRLCRFFDYIEEKYGVSMVIAAHPRSQYETQDHLFGRRPVIRGKTAELVRESGFVILHDSASINYPVLFRKPMIFITTDLLQKSRMGLTEFMASLFDKEVLNIDQSHDLNWTGELSVNDRLYDEYMNTYIKKAGTADTEAWQVFADCLKEQGAAGLM